MKELIINLAAGATLGVLTFIIAEVRRRRKHITTKPPPPSAEDCARCFFYRFFRETVRTQYKEKKR